jgi:hypothetical protein
VNVRSHEKVTGHAPTERRAIYYVKETIMIAAVMLMSVALVGILCVVAYTLATYALPVMLGFAAARLAYHTGSGLIGACFIGLIAAAAAFGAFSVLFATLRSPILRLIVALVFAAPAAIASYAGPRRDLRGDSICNLATDILHHRRSLRRRLGADAVGRLQNSSSFVRTIGLRSCFLISLMTLLLKDGAEDTLRAHST